MDFVAAFKILSSFLYPLGLALLFAGLSLLSRIRGSVGGSRWCGILSVAILLLSSNPMVAKKMAFSLEKQYPQLEVESIVAHDAIIVLGGGLRVPSPPVRYVQLAQGSDRYWYAARLFHAGKANKIILSGGKAFKQAGLHGEAYYAAQLLQQWGVPEEAISVELDSRNTSQNYRNTEKLIKSEGVQSALLVTSAIHMPRAVYLFSQLSIPITPASADVLIRERRGPIILSYLPSASALMITTAAMHEYYGLGYEKLKRVLFNS